MKTISKQFTKYLRLSGGLKINKEFIYWLCQRSSVWPFGFYEKKSPRVPIAAQQVKNLAQYL